MAVFGAGQVAKQRPSFVGVGAFETTLNQVAQNVVTYLELTATSQVQAQTLQLIAEDEAQATTPLKVAFDPSQPRDAHGQWTKGGGGIPAVVVDGEPIGLAAEARKAGSFEQFEHNYTLQIKHGLYWHLTKDPAFTIDPAKGPQDMSSMGDGGMTPGALMVTSHLENWDEYYNTDPETEEPRVTRPYVAMVDLSDVPHQDYHQISRGFGNEFFIPDSTKAKLLGVVPIHTALALDKQHHAAIPQSQEELRAFYDRVMAKKFDPAQPRDEKGRWVDEAGVTHVGETVELYHGTSRLRANKILKEGFKIRAVAKPTMGGDPESSRDYVWLAKQRGMAQSYSELHRYPAVVTVRLPTPLYEKLKRLNSGPDSVWSKEPIPAKYVTVKDDPHQPRDAEGQWTKGPIEPGTTPIPPGKIRGYHYTDSMESVEAGGLDVSKAKGASYGEPNAIWFSTAKPGDFKDYVEVFLDPDEIAGGGPLTRLEPKDSPENLQRIEEYNKGNHDFMVYTKQIPTDCFVTTHRPWHDKYRYITKERNSTLQADILAGEHDDLLDTPDYGPAVRLFKEQHAAKKWDESEHPRNAVGQFAVAAMQRGEPHTVSEDDFLNYHMTGSIPSGAYERYEAGDLEFIHRAGYETLLDTREINGQTVEIRLEAEPARYTKRTVAASDAERDKLYEDYEQAAKKLGTTPMMAGIDLGHDSDAYKALGKFEQRWRQSGEEFVRDAHGDLVYLTPEEMAAKDLPAVTYTVGAFVGDKTVGYAGDEFGASGVYVARAYQRHGLGVTLLKTYLEKSGRLAKGRQIGQMTYAGQQVVRGLHRQLVKEAAAKKFDPNQPRDEQGQWTGTLAFAYHGTTANFLDFDDAVLGKNTGARSAALGHFFTNTPKVAEGFAPGTGGNIRKQLLVFDKPFELSPGSSAKFTEVHGQKAIRVWDRDLDPFNQLRDMITKGMKKSSWKDVTVEDVQTVRDRLMQAGYDGIVLRDTVMDAGSALIGQPRPVHTMYIDLSGKALKFDPGQPRDASGKWTVTGTPAFKAWFKESKVVDEHGQPLVVYHGTRANFSQFGNQGGKVHWDTGYSGKGFYFADAKTASIYAGDKPGGAVVPVYLSLQNPLQVQEVKGGDDQIIAVAKALGITVPEGVDGINAYRTYPTLSKEITETLKAKGHDGVLYRWSLGNHTEYMVLDPTHIKSAIANRTFDPTDPHITKWDESQHPRDKEGQFASAGTLRQPGEETEDIEGAGPERKKWSDLNVKAMDTTEAFFNAKDAHRPHALRVWDDFVKATAPYSPEDKTQIAAIEAKVFSDPEYVETKTVLLAAQKAMEAAEAAVIEQTPRMKMEVVTNLATAEAQKMGVHPWYINVVDKEPREFTVGDKQFTEGGHFQPWDEMIEINVRNLDYGDAPVVRGMVSHELSHFVYHRVKAIADTEFEKYKAKAIDPHDSDQYTPWHTEHFERDPDQFGGYRVKATSQAVLAAEFPASTALSLMSGGPQHLFRGITREMVNENGHSAYAKSYWSKDAIAAKHSYESAINETIAEVTRYLHHPRSWHEDHPVNLESPWVKLTSAMHSYYRQRQARIDAAKQVNR